MGLNGTGKTNILDAIHYLSNTKSAFNAIDAQNIRHEMDYFVLNGAVNKKDKSFVIHCSLKRKEITYLILDVLYVGILKKVKQKQQS